MVQTNSRVHEDGRRDDLGLPVLCLTLEDQQPERPSSELSAPSNPLDPACFPGTHSSLILRLAPSTGEGARWAGQSEDGGGLCSL